MNKYPSKTIEVEIDSEKFELKEFTIGYRLESIKDELTLNDIVVGLEDAGLPTDKIKTLTESQAVAIYSTVQTLTYGEVTGEVENIDIEDIKKN